MAAAPTILERPQRWDAAFDPDMTEAAVGGCSPPRRSARWTPENFPAHAAPRNPSQRHPRPHFLQGRNHSAAGSLRHLRISDFERRGRVVLKPDLAPSLLGRQAPGKKGIFRTLAQFWTARVRRKFLRESNSRQASGLGARQTKTRKCAFSCRTCRVCWTSTAPNRCTHGRFFRRDRRVEPDAAHVHDFCRQRRRGASGDPLAGFARPDEI